MDKKDDLLQQSMDKLREITSRNMRRVYDDIWGALHPGETGSGKQSRCPSGFQARNSSSLL